VESEIPTIERYTLLEKLGAGAFGVVYRAWDPQLKRYVAIKIARGERINTSADANAYLEEAQNVAQLDHPGIVAVYDTGTTADGLIFIVSKLIAGTNLEKHLQQHGRLATSQAAELVASAAEALHHAHQRGLIHRDIKPANILLDESGKPTLADFGLALRSDQPATPGIFGTLLYMSPEQARGEGHRVDARSDIYSLGVVLFEALCGRVPYRAKSSQQLCEEICCGEVRPPRQLHDDIPRELDRICLCALERRAKDRYSTAIDLARDLRNWLSSPRKKKSTASRAVKTVAKEVPATEEHSARHSELPASRAEVKVRFRGLCSYQADDQDFFLQLLPGQVDRDGLPQSIRFWKSFIENNESDLAHSIGVSYGPSGCGKSSIFRAGVVPRLAQHVVPLLIDAAHSDTEQRILRELRRHCPDIPTNADLATILAQIRQGEYLPPGKKLCLILDQFEQWLHVNREEQNSTLARALRHCDGGRLQSVLLCRSDFWMSLVKFMSELEIRPAEDVNCAPVHLFDAPHAKRVLISLGRTFGCLQEDGGQIRECAQEFLDLAVTLLTNGEDLKHVVPVRLAMFAHMMQGKPWTPATIQQAGGTEGIGVLFLEEQFSSEVAPLENRLHQDAAKAVLKSLLSDNSTELKGPMRSAQELASTANLSSQPQQFAVLLDILETKLRLISPADAPPSSEEKRVNDGCETSSSKQESRYYQLTHDFLVPTLRQWLQRKQRETRRGRAQLLLGELASMWKLRREDRFLPSVREYLAITLLTSQRAWTASETSMMSRANRVYLIRSLCLAAVLATLAIFGFAWRDRLMAREAQQLVKHLLQTGTIESVPGSIDNLSAYRHWANADLRAARQSSNSSEQLRAALALLPEPGQVDFLRERMVQADPITSVVVAKILAKNDAQLQESLWKLLEDDSATPAKRFRAACALVVIASDDSNAIKGKGLQWQAVAPFVASQLVATLPQNLTQIDSILEMLRPASEHLIDPISQSLQNASASEIHQKATSEALVKYTLHVPDKLAEQVSQAPAAFFDVLFRELEDHPQISGQLAESLHRRLHMASSPLLDVADQSNALASQQANQVVALFRLGKADELWPHLKSSSNPLLRSFIIHRLCDRGGDLRAIAQRLNSEQDPSSLAALILIVGQSNSTQLKSSERNSLIQQLAETYRSELDSGVHGAAGWCLRRWNERTRLAELDRELSGPDYDDKSWYLNCEGHTMVAISSDAASPRHTTDTSATQQIDSGHRFAISAHEVTLAQFRRSNPPDYRSDDEFLAKPIDEKTLRAKSFGPPDDACPANAVSWYLAAWYCNWLSQRAGIPQDQWCYEPNSTGQFAAGMKLSDDYKLRIGYRLPTKDEWELSCRAGTGTSRYFGDNDGLLMKYAWYQETAGKQMHPVGLLMPNDWGLFDTLGNALEWCNESADDPRSLLVREDQRRVTKGGAFVQENANLTVSKQFDRHTPNGLFKGNDDSKNSQADFVCGFRVARSLGKHAAPQP
jgi:serine/threonine protein kinase/formylglycine-generating enzyme required for sulfatase activity